MLNLWFYLVLLCMAVNWLAVWFSWKTVNMVSKPAIMIALLAWFFTNAGFKLPALWFGMGLIFALAGDTLLLFEGKPFLFGTILFMTTHLAYSLGFNQCPLVMRPAVLALALASASLWIVVFTTLRQKALQHPDYRKMEILLILYNLLILMMAISALLTIFRPEWPPAASALAACGALLFLFSDTLLAIDRFIMPLAPARLWKRVTYQLGQLAIIAGVLLAFSGGNLRCG